MLHTVSRFLRGFLTALLVIVVLLVAAVAYLGFTASGNQFLANRIAEQVSTPDMQVSLEGASGLLEGRFHLDRVTLADTRGKFAEVQGLDIFWTPSELVKMRLHADRIAAAKVTFDRPPVKTIESEPSSSSFSLPVEIKVDSFDLPHIALGKAIARQDTVLGINGSAQAVSDRIALEFNAAEKDRLNASAKASATYAVNTETLTLDGAVSEPQGGLLARLLSLPGQPPVEIAVKGDGPLNDWKGSISGRVDGKDVLLLTGSHRLAEAGIHEITLNGGGQISQLLPRQFRSLFSGETKVDVDARFAETGLVDIRAGSITNDSLTLVANGQLDPKGQAKLTGDLRPAKNVIHLELPLASGTVKADVSKANVTLSGAFRSAVVDLDAALAHVETPDVQAGNTTLTVHSDDLNLADKTATLSYAFAAETLALQNPSAAKIVQGPLSLRGNVDIGLDTIALAQSDLESAKLGGKISGKFQRTTRMATANFNLFVLPQGLLPANIETRIRGTLGLSGQLAATLPSQVSVQNLKLTSNLLTAVGSMSLNGDTIKTDLAGDVLNLGDFADKAAGKAHFTLAASGPLAKPDIAARVTSSEVKFADRAMQAVDVKLESALDLKKPGGKLTVAATYLGQTITAAADGSFDKGLIYIPSLKLDIGKNTLSGALNLDAALLPSGKLAFNLPDVGSLTKLAGQTADGALKGTIELAAADGKVAGTISAAGPRLNSAGVEITNPKVDLRIADLLTQKLSGTIAASAITAGTNHLDEVALDIALAGPQIDFDLASRFDAAPLAAKGMILQQDGGLAVRLASFSAAPHQVPVRLALPADIVVSGGKVQLSGLTVEAGDGTATIDGTAGKGLDLKAKIADLPVKLANAFAKNLDAAGTLSGNATITGDAASPRVQFDVDIRDLATSQTRKAKLPTLNIAANIQFADNMLALTANSTLRDQPTRVNASVKLDNGVVAIPSFKADIGQSSVSGSMAFDPSFQPSGRIAFDIPDANALASIVGEKAEGAVKGTVDLTSGAGSLDARIDATGTIRNQEIQALVAARQQNGSIAFPSLKVDIGRNTLSGAVTLDDQLMPSGKVSFDFPDIALLAAMAGQKAEGSIKGTADIASTGRRIDAKINAGGLVHGQAIDVQTDVVSDNGAISLPSLLAKIGPNSLSAALTLDKAFLPAGKVTFDFPDLGLLASMAGQKAEGAIKGTADIASDGGKIDAKVSATGLIRNQTIDIETNVVSDHGAISVPSLSAQIGSNQLNGRVTLDGAFMPSGKIAFDLPDVALLAAMAGQKAEGAIKGAADIASSGSRIDAEIIATGVIRNQTIDIRTNVVSDNGAISVPSLKANIGANILAGTLALDRTLLPTGKFSFDFPDIGLLAAFAGQQAQGALKGSATLSSDNGKIGGSVTASGETVTVAGTRIVNPSVDLKIADLAAGQLSGHVTADQVAAGANRIDRLALNVELVDRQTHFDLTSQFDGAPLTAKGELAQQNDGLKLSVNTFAAAPREIPVKLEKATDIVIRDGAVMLTDLTIQAGAGTVTINGKAGKVLDLRVKANALPLSLANAVSPDLDAAGTVSADIEITGDAASPLVSFDSHLANIATRQTRGANLPDLTMTARGQFANDTLSLTADSMLRDQPTKVEASVKLDNGAITVPSFRADIGKSSFAGNLALDPKFQPAGKISFDIPDANTLASIVGRKAEGAIKGTADITSTDGKIDVSLDAAGMIRSQAIKALADISLEKGAVSLPSLKLDIGKNTLSGAVTLGQDLLPSGKITFDLPDIALLAAMAGQKAEGAIKGSADIASANGRTSANIAATGLIRNQTIDIRTNVVSDNGAVSIPSLEANIGANMLTGTLALDKTFMPTGRFSFDFPDIGLLAAFAGQQAQGALKGSATLSSDNGKISGAVNASGETVTTAGIRIVNPSIDLEIADLAAGQLAGRMAANQIVAGANQIDQLALDVELVNRQTHFDLTSQFDGAPLLAKGQLVQDNGGLKLSLNSFTAAPRRIPVKLAKATDIVIKDGAVTLTDLVVEAGKGSISVSGTAGKTLDLKARIDTLPLSLANTVSPDLDAAGTVSADIKVTGDAASPAIAFDSRLADIATSQTRTAKLPNLTITTKGQFANDTLSLTANSMLRDQPAKIEASAKLDNGAVRVPSFKADIGKSSFSGNLALDPKFRPAGKISFDIPDVNALASIVGQKAEGALKGAADIASNDGRIGVKLDASGAIRGQAIKALADISLEKGAVSLPSLKLDVGKNTLSGAVTLGKDFLPSGKITFDLPDVALLAAMAGQTAEGAIKGSADIKSDQGRIGAKVAASGLIRKQPITVDVEAVREGDRVSLPSLKIDVGRNTLSGALALDKAFMPTGKVNFDLPDIGLLAAMAGQKAEGAIKGSADIKSDNGKISGAITAQGTKLTAAGAEIVKPLVDLKIVDLAAGQISGKVTADRVAQGTNVLARLSLDFDHAGAKTAFDLKSQYDASPLTAKGAIEQQPEGITVLLDSFAATPKKIPVKLDRPTEIRIRNGAVALSSLAISAGRGSIVVTGSAGPKLDLTAKVTALPASLANAFSPGLDAAGTISANVTVKGNPSAPTVAFDTTWQGAAVSQTRAAGLASFTVTAKGQLANSVLSVNANARGGDGLQLNAAGTVGISGNRALNIKASGQLPFAALASRLAAQGLDLRGNARFDIAVTGAATNPSITGRINTSGATLTAIRQNLTIKNLAATVNLDGRQARIASLTGALSGGGTVSVTGTVGIAPDSGFPADIRIALKNAVYTDAKIVAAKLSGDLTITGSLVRSPELGGTIQLRRADITIPQKLPGTLAQIDIRHKHASRAVVVQAQKIKENQPGTKSGKDTGGLQLDLRILAPRQIFVRGRGLDAELGGEVTLSGSSQAPNASGGFKMLRGRLSIIGRRLDFTQGEITFGGDLTPALNMVATSAVEATTINVIVAGLANNPSVTFTSSPSLPQDEVMALLIFGRNSADLSPVQIAQLADAVSTLAGGQSNSLFNKLRQGLGVDDLDVGTDENGKSNVSVGKYLNKRTYLQLQQNVDDNTSSAIINLDIGKGVKLRGEAGSDGSTAGGVFFEKEY